MGFRAGSAANKFNLTAEIDCRVLGWALGVDIRTEVSA